MSNVTVKAPTETREKRALSDILSGTVFLGRIPVYDSDHKENRLYIRTTTGLLLHSVLHALCEVVHEDAEIIVYDYEEVDIEVIVFRRK